MTDSGWRPALDGLRGACLLAVLLFHSGFAWASGGFLGVSTFFTLSGFLVGSILLAEEAKTGGISLRDFRDRRLRRLLPASVATVAAVVATAPWWLGASRREQLPLDALASLAWVANLRFQRPAYAYDLLFSDPSPLVHFWSLAIEGQFYLVFPLVVAAVLRAGGGRRALAILCALGFLASVAAVQSAPDTASGRQFVYYATRTRVAEILAGVLLALAWTGSATPAAEPRLARGLRITGPLAALALAWCWHRVRLSDPWLYRGGLAAHSGLSALVVASAWIPGGPLVRLLSARWLRWIGEVSYGAYLFHWPLFLVLSPGRTGLGPGPLLALRCLATFALAACSHRFLEMPARRPSVVPWRRFALASVGATALVAALAVAERPAAVTRQVAQVFRSIGGGSSRGGSGRPLRVGLFGDSTAMSLAMSLEPWLSGDGGFEVADGDLLMGCGLLEMGEREVHGEWVDEAKAEGIDRHGKSARCRDLPRRWAGAVREQRLDVAVVFLGWWEVCNRRSGPGAPVVHVGQPAVDRELASRVERLVDDMTRSGVPVVWILSPRVRAPLRDGVVLPSDGAAAEPSRMDRFDEIVREVAARRRDRMRTIDLGEHLRGTPAGEFDPALRADVHFSTDGGAALADEWLGPALLRAVDELVEAGGVAAGAAASGSTGAGVGGR